MSTKVITPVATLSYPHLATPQEAEVGKKAKYSATFVFAPGTDLSALRAAALEAAIAKWGKTYKVAGKDVPMQEALAKEFLRNGFRTDAEKKGYPEGSVFINTRTEQKPGCVFAHADPETKKPVPMTSEQIVVEMYPGARVRGSVTAFAYDTSGNAGVSFALNNLQKIGEGERLDGRVSAENEFDTELGQEPADLSSLT